MGARSPSDASPKPGQAPEAPRIPLGEVTAPKVHRSGSPNPNAGVAGLVERARQALRRYRPAVAATMLGASAVGLSGCAGVPLDAGYPTPEPVVRSVGAPAPSLPDLHNDDRVARAEARIDAVPGLRARLPESVQDALREGVRRPRHPTFAPEGIMGASSALRAATATAALPRGQLDRLEALLEAAGRAPNGALAEAADPDAERALILEALGVRGARGRVDRRAFSEVTRFAEQIRGAPRDVLVRTTTGLDVDPRNTSRIAPTALALGDDAAGDNDGLYQRWVDACGPTTAQLLLSELDPIFARDLHAELDRLDPRAGGGEAQARVLSRAGAPVASRLARQTLSIIAPSLSPTSPTLDPAEQEALRAWFSGRDLDDEARVHLARGVQKLRARHGAPSDEALAALRGDDDRSGAGMILTAAFDAVLADRLGIRIREVEVPSAALGAHLDRIAERLRDGEDVPVRAGGPSPVGHALLFTDVRGQGAHRWFQLADPWTGRTAWARQADVLSGDFLAEVVELAGLDRLTHYYVTEPR